MKIVSGSSSEKLYFVAVSTVDFYTRVTGLSAFNVYASVNGSTGSTAYSITVSEVNSSQMPGVYTCNIADSTLTALPAGIDNREVMLHIVNSSMATVDRTFEIYRRSVTTGATLTVSSSGETVVKTNNDKTGYALTAGERNSISDALLDRDMSTGLDSGSSAVRTPRQALRFLRNKWTVGAGTLTVYKEDDVTASWTGTVTTLAGADPITGNDPA